MENKKNNKGLITIIIILSICIGGLVGYIVYDKLNKKDESTIKETTTTTTISPVSSTTQKQREEVTNKNGELQKSNIKNCNEKMCSETINGLNIKYYPQKNGMESTLIINEKEILNDIYWLSDLYVLDETIIIITSSMDIRTTKIYLVDKLGNIQKEIYNLDTNYKEMVISDVENAIEITKEGIILKGTRITHGPSIATYYYDNSLSMEDYYIGKCDIYNKYVDENIYGTYEIKYLGDNKFSEIKNLDYTKLKDSDIRCSN